MSKRIIASIEDEQYENLQQASTESGIPMAEIIRRAIEAKLWQMQEDAFLLREARYIPTPDPRSV